MPEQDNSDSRIEDGIYCRRHASAVETGGAGPAKLVRSSFFVVGLATCLISLTALLSGCAFLFELFPEAFPYPDEPGFADPNFQDLYRTDDLFHAAYDEYHGKYILFRQIKQWVSFDEQLPLNPSPAQIQEFKYFKVNSINFKTFETDLQHYELGVPKLASADKFSYQQKYKATFQLDYAAVSGSMLQLQRYASDKLGCQISIHGGATACPHQGLQAGFGVRF